MNGNGRVGSGLRQRKRFETRRGLSQAAIRLCTQRGWENVTVDDIATAANVSPRTFRNYFSTKAEAVAARHLERMLHIANEVRTRPPEEPLWTAITHAVMAQFEAPGQEAEDIADASLWKERIRFLLTEPAIQGEVLKADVAAQPELAKAIAERIGASHVNELYPQLAAAVVTAVVDVVGRRWLRDGPSGSIVPLLRNAFDLVGDGFRERETKTGR
jgi:AcrR family transcriptional regulator